MKNEIKSKRVYNLIILDESGSMESIKESMISGFNELCQNLKTIVKQYDEQKHSVSFITFNSSGIKNHYWNQEVEKIKPIDTNSYKPDNMTPLYDTLGITFTKLKSELAAIEDYHVVVTIMTDGMENSSIEYSGRSISDMISELKNTGRWTFAYIGTDHDIYQVARDLNISNVMSFNKSQAGVKNALFTDLNAKSSLFAKLSRQDTNLGEDYFMEDEDKK